MTEINAQLVKELREETSVGMMECKKALVEAGGDKQKAVKILRERGLALAGKKAARTANQGLIAAEITSDLKTGALVEINCETDFVAKNVDFQQFVAQMAAKAVMVDGELAPLVADEVAAEIIKIGENIVVRRNTTYRTQGAGLVARYIHLGGKVGVLMELGCQKEGTAGMEMFKELAKDITLHIAACSPQFLVRQDVPADLIQSEREIYAKQVANKPANILEKIVVGKLEKFYAQVCLVEQGFVKDPDTTITGLLKKISKELGDEVAIRRFVRYQVGV